MVVTFGEIMLRLSPPNAQRILQANNFEMYFGGSEANVAVFLSNMGVKTRFVTKLPKNDIGLACKTELAKWNVDTSYVKMSQNQKDRMGIYFCENGYEKLVSKVIYDRAYSAFSQASPSDYNWEEIFADAKWFHYSGITPALGDNVSHILLDACETAKRMGLTVSCDCNYRSALWTREYASQVMRSFMPYTDILVASGEDLREIFGVTAEKHNPESYEERLENAEILSQSAAKMYGLSTVAVPVRETVSASETNWSAVLYSQGEVLKSRMYHIRALDRVGAGDSFSGGLIYGMLKKWDASKALDFAAAACCMKHYIKGDFCTATEEEINSFLKDEIADIKR